MLLFNVIRFFHNLKMISKRSKRRFLSLVFILKKGFWCLCGCSALKRSTAEALAVLFNVLSQKKWQEKMCCFRYGACWSFGGEKISCHAHKTGSYCSTAEGFLWKFAKFCIVQRFLSRPWQSRTKRFCAFFSVQDGQAMFKALSASSCCSIRCSMCKDLNTHLENFIACNHSMCHQVVFLPSKGEKLNSSAVVHDTRRFGPFYCKWDSST